MVRWTRFVIAHRKRILAAWVVILVAAGTASAGLSDLLTTRFTIPGSEAEKGFNLLTDKFKQQGDGFTLVVSAKPGTQPAVALAAGQAAADRGAKAAKGNAAPLQPAGRDVYFTQLSTPLEFADAADITPKVRKAIGKDPPSITTYLTGGAAIKYDTDPIFAEDLAKGETIAAPIALLVLAFMLGTVGAIFVPIVFALITIPTTLGFVWIFAHLLDMPQEVTNIVTLIGLAIAIDYSMLIVFRYREELRRCDDRCDIALLETMRTAGHATVFSGLTVALGLGLLILMPLPFMQAMGIGGLLVPLVSIAACLTFLPALLSVMDTKINRFRVVPKRVLESRQHVDRGMWARLAGSIMRRPIPYLVAGGLIMLALIYPATEMKLTGGDNRGLPDTTEATMGLKILERTLGPGALAPNDVVVDTGKPGGAYTAKAIADQQELASSLSGDQEVVTVDSPAPLLGKPGKPGAATFGALRKANLVDPTGRYWLVRATGRADSGTETAKQVVHRIRDEYVPASGIEKSNKVYVTGAPAFGVDFIDVAYGAFPYLVAAVLVLTYILLLRAFRSLFLPVKAVFMNVLSVAATFGVLVLAFQHHWGSIAGWQASPQIDAWIPIFLFAMLFGLSMDYEVFLLSRMREEWDKTGDNVKAVTHGLQHTGRIITAAAVIMIAAFAGFTAGSFVGLQEFGLGLSAAILLDATIVRSLLVPAAMRLLGDWNWYLPPKVARFMRVPVVIPAIVEGPVEEIIPRAQLMTKPQAEALGVEREERGKSVRIRLTGELDLATRGLLAGELEQVEGDWPELIVIDLQGLDYMDSAGLGELIGAARRARSDGRRVVLVRGPAPIERILDLASVDGLLERVPDARSAGFN